MKILRLIWAASAGTIAGGVTYAAAMVLSNNPQASVVAAVLVGAAAGACTSKVG